MQKSLLTILRRLSAAEIRFIVAGGVAAAMNGAPVQTYDIDAVYSREKENLERLLRLLEEIDAVFRIQPERRLRPTASHLSGSGHLNLITLFGPLDLLATVGAGLGYQDLLPETVEMDIGEGMRIRVMKLETIIALKEQVGSEKDLAMLPLLRRTLAERKLRGIE